MASCTRCGVTIPINGGEQCYKCINIWLSAAGGQLLTSQPIVQTNNNQQIEQLKNDVEFWKNLCVKTDREKDALKTQVSQLQTAKTTAERERDALKTQVSQLQTAKTTAERERDDLKKQIEQLKLGDLINDYQRLTKQKNGKEGALNNGREWREIYFNEKYVGKENKEFDLLTFYKKDPFNYLWDSPKDTVLWLKKADLLKKDSNTIFDAQQALPLSAEVHQALERLWQAQVLEQKYTKLNSEHATCTTTIQTLTKDKQALQKQVDELNSIITGVPQPQVEAEARVQQANLPPK